MFIKVKFRTQLMTNIYHRKSCELVRFSKEVVQIVQCIY